MNRKIVCYECFGNFTEREIRFRCDRTPDKYKDPCELIEDPITGEVTTRVFRNDRPATSKTAKCSVCGTTTNIRVCPRCHEPLLHFAGETEEFIIAIVGGPRAGKSHYFTVLIEECLNRFIAKDFGSFIAPTDAKTTMEYLQNYKGPIYIDKHEIQATRARSRLVFRMSFKQRNFMRRETNRVITLVFYDISGELLSAENISQTALQYLWNSRGIIYLANPLHFASIRALISSNGEEQPIQTPDIIFNNLTQALRQSNEISPKEKIKIPLAICLSQSDRLMDIDSPADRFSDKIFSKVHQHQGKFNTKDFKVINAEIREKLNEKVGEGFGNQATTDFKNVGFFAASALGMTPAGGMISSVDPIRVEDPFLWVLSQLKVIKSD